MVFSFFKKKKEEKPARPDGRSGGETKPEEKAEVDVQTEDVEDKKDVVAQTEPAAPSPISGISVLRHMHISEKSSRGQAMNQYTFIVTPRATKPEIAKEVASRYKVTVRSVHIMNRGGKSRRIGRQTGMTPGIKKAIVTIADGQTIAAA